MKRIDKIYFHLKEKCKNITKEKLLKIKGFSAKKIGEDLSILRNNVSKELNELCRENKVIKTKGRPVLYFDKEILESIIHKKLPTNIKEIESIEELLIEKEEITSPFENLIGVNTSLKNQIEQAKAAIFYPPNGLHTLIVGETGSGKTLFANMMYSYAKYIKRLNEKSPFVVFNCADYYNNQQLLLSHIFGHIKGAFTGADSERIGLVEKANGGILFLDEIHRLPPEGQEMLFYFMDTGTFNKLGESDRDRTSNVLIIGATTENPDSILLKTFTRRIPITIKIPNFKERTSKDKIDILKHLLSNEAHRVKKPVKISQEAIKALIGSTTYGNVGQLKSNIQLVCAKAFLNSLENTDYIRIDFNNLPKNIKSGLLYVSNKREELHEMWKMIPEELSITETEFKELSNPDPYELPFNIYKIIEDKTNILKEEGVSQDYINKFITTDINLHIKCFYTKFNNNDNRKKILKIVDKEVLDLAEELKNIAEKKLSKTLNDRFLYALSLHLSSFFNRLGKKDNIKYTNINEVKKNNYKEYEVAIEFKNLIEEKYNMDIPEEELIYFTLILTSIEEAQNDGKIGVIVVAHGDSTASSMASVAKKLLEYENVLGIDMPLEINPMDVLKIMTEKVKKIDMGKGVLILVDMGSLNTFGASITENTGIPTKTIDMVSTALVIEAVRKSNMLNVSLNELYNSLKGFKGYSSIYENNNSNEANLKTIVTLCSSGMGSALKIKELLTNIIQDVSNENIDILPLGIRDINSKILNLSKERKIIATVGIIDPKLDIPFISIESLINDDIEHIVKDILKENKIEVKGSEDSNIVVDKLCMDSLNEFLTYLNPSKILSVLNNFVSVLENNMNIKFSNFLKIRIIIHVGCALERMILKDGLKYDYKNSNLDEFLFKATLNASEIFYDRLKIKLTKDEICYISEILVQKDEK